MSDPSTVAIPPQSGTTSHPGGFTSISNNKPVRGERLPLLDLLRVLAAHVVVWHHLSFYGPLSDVAYQLVPGPIWAFSEWGRNAVQVFFVVGGFAMARGLDRRGGITLSTAGQLIARRYRRIGGPYLVTLLIAIAANALADYCFDHDSISAPPSLSQLLAHVVFLQDLLDYEALTAGIWYLAIDIQLGLLLLGIVMLSQRIGSKQDGGDPSRGGQELSRPQGTQTVAALLLVPLAGASLLWFNRDPAWDAWGIYFLGSYSLGVVTEWTLSKRLPTIWFWGYAALMLLALSIEWRIRLACCLATGLLIFAGGLTGLLTTWPRSQSIQAAASTSYSLFLIHFPVCLLVNAVLSQVVLSSPAMSLAGMMLAYLLSVAASLVFYRYVERHFV